MLFNKSRIWIIQFILAFNRSLINWTKEAKTVLQYLRWIIMLTLLASWAGSVMVAKLCSTVLRTCKSIINSIVNTFRSNVASVKWHLRGLISVTLQNISVPSFCIMIRWTILINTKKPLSRKLLPNISNKKMLRRKEWNKFKRHLPKKSKTTCKKKF